MIWSTTLNRQGKTISSTNFGSYKGTRLKKKRRRRKHGRQSLTLSTRTRNLKIKPLPIVGISHLWNMRSAQRLLIRAVRQTVSVWQTVLWPRQRMKHLRAGWSELGLWRHINSTKWVRCFNTALTALHRVPSKLARGNQSRKRSLTWKIPQSMGLLAAGSLLLVLPAAGSLPVDAGYLGHLESRRHLHLRQAKVTHQDLRREWLAFKSLHRAQLKLSQKPQARSGERSRQLSKQEKQKRKRWKNMTIESRLSGGRAHSLTEKLKRVRWGCMRLLNWQSGQKMVDRVAQIAHNQVLSNSKSNRLRKSKGYRHEDWACQTWSRVGLHRVKTHSRLLPKKL